MTESAQQKTITAYGYGLRYRPPQLGAVPKGFLIVPGSTFNAPDYGAIYRFGVIYYPQPLDEHDIRAYELVYNGTAELECSDPYNDGYEWRVLSTVFETV